MRVLSKRIHPFYRDVFFSSYLTSIVLTMAEDITDYETARSVRFVFGLIGTVFSLTDSIASALAPIIIGLVIAATGYTNVYQMLLNH